MHSGINTYIPRGIGSLEKRLTPEQLIDLRIDGSVKMIREGLNHTQKVYKSVYEFTNLVKQNVVLDKKEVDIKELLEESISKTSYAKQVELGELPTLQVNETLFWNAIDNLIKNGLKYNDSESKLVKIYFEDDTIIIEDNGKGLTKKQFEKIIKSKREVEDVEEAGLGLNICLAIVKEHGFELDCEKVETGTKMRIKVK
jgi:K+-sensing histidine kinase KdpD